MKDKILLSLILIGLVFPVLGEARSLSELKGIKLVSFDEINKVCHQPEGYDPISGCYFPSDGISIRNDLPKERFIFVFWHEIGHFFMEGITEEQYKIAFNPTPQKSSATVLQEIAADTFALWMMGGKVPKIQEEFFVNILVN